MYNQIRPEVFTKNSGSCSKDFEDLHALVLLSNLSTLYERMDGKQKNNLLRIIVKRIIINREGEIISHELHSPFSYLSTLVEAFTRQNEEGFRSEHVALGVQNMQGKTVIITPVYVGDYLFFI